MMANFSAKYPDGHPQKLLDVKIKGLLKVKYTNFDDALLISAGLFTQKIGIKLRN